MLRGRGQPEWHNSCTRRQQATLASDCRRRKRQGGSAGSIRGGPVPVCDVKGERMVDYPASAATLGATMDVMSHRNSLVASCENSGA